MSDQNKNMFETVQEIMGALGVTSNSFTAKFKDIPTLRQSELFYEHTGVGREDIEVVDTVITVQGNMTEVAAALISKCREHGLHFYQIRAYQIRASDSNESYIGVRFFWDVDHECYEHPEMLLGAPLGQYHCPQCGAMQCAGVPHISIIEELVADIEYEFGSCDDLDFQIHRTQIKNVPQTEDGTAVTYIEVGDNVQPVVDVFVVPDEDPDSGKHIDVLLAFLGAASIHRPVHIGRVGKYEWIRFFPQDRLPYKVIDSLVEMYKTHLK